MAPTGHHERGLPSATHENTQSNLDKTPPRDSYWFAHGGIEVINKNAQSSNSPASGDPKDAQSQKDKAERIRMFHEQQEEERLRKLKDLEQQFLLAKKHRELQEEERKRRIEEARLKEMERRQQVEERKRQIWEAEQERKEAILRRNMEREARIEARRNAQRNSQCFAFGSSTPRTFDLDLAAIGAGRNASPGLLLMSSISGRRSEERDVGPPRSTSACSLDRKCNNTLNADNTNDQQDLSRSSDFEPSPVQFSSISKQIAFHHNCSTDMKACLSMWDYDPQRSHISLGGLSSGCLVGSGVFIGEDCMTRSMISLSSSSAFRGRKRTDIVPTLTRERSITPHVGSRGNCSRAVSMTRLDQLAQPRRPFRTPYTTTTNAVGVSRAMSPSVTKSMVNLSAPPSSRRVHVSVASRQRGNMSQSMMHLADSPRKDARGLTPSPTAPKSSMRSAQSMMHLAAAPRLTRTARLRAEALAKSRAASAWNLNNPDAAVSSGYLYPGKDSSRSPSRPQSSMSGASEVSATSSSISAVNMRARSAPRRPRPYSIAGSSTERTPIVFRKDPERLSRHSEREAHSTVPKQSKEKSTSSEKPDEISRPKKPLPPPKTKEIMAKAKSHHVPVKDNLRKTVKASSHAASQEAGYHKNAAENDENIDLEDKENIQRMATKSAKEPKSEIMAEIVNSSPIASPVTDSDMCISSEDSRIMTDSELNSCNLTFSESGVRIEATESSKTNAKKPGVKQLVSDDVENIPSKVDPNSISENDTLVAESNVISSQEVVCEKKQIVKLKPEETSLVSDQVLVRESSLTAAIDNSLKESSLVAEEKHVKESIPIVAEEKPVKDSRPDVAEKPMKESRPIVAEEKPVKDSRPDVAEKPMKENRPIVAEEKPVKDSRPDVAEKPMKESRPDVAEKPVKEKNSAVSEEKPRKDSSSVVAEKTVSESENAKEMIASQKPRITSEEEAKAALAEKRRLAREKAEREAELEKQRLEEIRRQEEERHRLEEQEQKRLEEEQIRLAELHRQLEAEKLQKAIEEQRKREEEEQKQKEEEARQKAEKEEQERKAREEAEKQRLELEEKLRKEEEERAERKRRVEQIMARTRGKSNAASTPGEAANKSSKTDAATPNSTLEKLRSTLLSPAQETTRAKNILNGIGLKSNSMSTSFTSDSVSDNPFDTLGECDMSKSYPLPDLLNSDAIALSSAKSNGHHEEGSTLTLSSSISESSNLTSNRTVSANSAVSPVQTNGYSSHEEMSCTTSPEETSDGLLINVESSPLLEVKDASSPADFTRLVDIDQSSLNLNENYVISVDKVNSNLLTDKSFTNKQKTDSSVVDLLS